MASPVENNVFVRLQGESYVTRLGPKTKATFSIYDLTKEIQERFHLKPYTYRITYTYDRRNVVIRIQKDLDLAMDSSKKQSLKLRLSGLAVQHLQIKEKAAAAAAAVTFVQTEVLGLSPTFPRIWNSVQSEAVNAALSISQTAGAEKNEVSSTSSKHN